MRVAVVTLPNPRRSTRIRTTGPPMWAHPAIPRVCAAPVPLQEAPFSQIATGAEAPATRMNYEPSQLTTHADAALGTPFDCET